MPGIAGLFSGVPNADSQIDRMHACLLHEPSFSSGISRHPALGVRVGWALHRGSFADCMPVWNEARDVCLIFSGEVFCDPADLETLRQGGRPVDPGDAGLLMHLYQRWGLDFVQRLNGGFSGVLIDHRLNKAFLFNDRYGAGRIYCRETPDGLYFSSEAKSLLRLFPDSRQLDPAAVAQTVALGCVMGDATLFPGISLLPPGAMWSFGPGAGIRRSFWFSRDSWQDQPAVSESAFEEELESVFSGILPSYLEARQRLAMSLTGGIDGRMIMAWAKRTPGALPCYSFGSRYRDCADVSLARRIAQHCGQSHSTIVVGKEMIAQFPALAARSVYLSDGTMDVSGAVELYVNRIARELAPIRLTGNYGSEIVRGNVAFRPRPYAAELFEPDFRHHLEGASKLYREERARGDDLSFIAFKQVPWHHHARLSVEQSQLTVRSPYLDNRLVGLMFRAPASMRSSQAASLHVIHRGDPALARMPTDRGLTHGPTSFPCRLRSAIQEFTAKAEYAYDYGMPHWLARVDHALSPLGLERLFLGRHKFYHFRAWYRGPLAPFVRETLLTPEALQRSCYRPSAIEAMVRRHIEGQGNHTLEIHRALTIELIHRELLQQSDQDAVHPSTILLAADPPAVAVTALD